MSTQTSKSNRAPWILVGVLGCFAVCLFAALVGGGLMLLRTSGQGTNNLPLTSVPIPPPPGGGGVPPPPPPVDHGVTCLIEQEGAIFANAPDLHNYLSDDAGITWREAFRSGLPNGSYCLGRDKPWQLFAAMDGQVQYRITPEVGIERSEDGGKTWKREVDLADESWQAKPQTGTPVKVEAKPGPFDAMVHRPTGNIVAAMGHLGVLVRTPEGRWQWIRVGNYYRGDLALLPTPAPCATANATPLPTPAAPHKLLTAHPQNTTNNSFGLAFSADSQMLAMVGFDAVHLWRTADWSQIRTVGQKGGRGIVQGIALSPDGQTLAYTEGSTDNTVQVWKTKDGALLRKLQGHTSWITSVAVSADGQTFASGGSFRDPSVRLWRVSDGAPLRTLTGQTSGVTRIAFSPDGQLLAAGGPNHIWRIADGTLLYTFQGGQRLPTLESGVLKNGSLAFSADSKSLFAVEGDTSMRVWNMSDGSLARTIMIPLPHGFDVQSAAFSSDRKLLATGLGDGTIWLWRLEDMTLLSRFTFNQNWANVAELAFSPDGTLLAATSDSGNAVRVWGLSPSSALAVSAAATASAQRIITNRRDVDISILPNGDMNIQEIGEVKLVGGPFTSLQKEFDTTRLKQTMDNFQVSEGDRVYATAPDQTYNYAVTRLGGGNYVVKWNFPAVADQVRTFTVCYTVHGALRSYRDTATLDWQAVEQSHGNTVWDATATVHLPADVPASQLKITADKNGSATVIDSRTVRFNLDRELDPADPFTIGLQFPESILDR